MPNNAPRGAQNEPILSSHTLSFAHRVWIGTKVICDQHTKEDINELLNDFDAPNFLDE